MTALEELLEQAIKNKKKKIAVISTEFVIQKIREHKQSHALYKPPERLIETR